MGGNEEELAGLFSVVVPDRTRGSGHNNHGIQSEYRETKKKKSEGDQALEQVGQRSCGVSFLENIQNPAVYGPGQPSLADSARAGRFLAPQHG